MRPDRPASLALWVSIHPDLGAGKIWDKHYLTSGPLLVYKSSHPHAPQLRFTVVCAGLPRPHRVVRVPPDLAPTATASLARKIAKISARPGNLFGESCLTGEALRRDFAYAADEQVQVLELEAGALLAVMRQNFAFASEEAGAPVGGEEPVRATVAAFELPVDLVRAAAELWITEEELSASLGVLPPDLAPLAQGSIPRHVFTANFAEAVCQLKIGKTSWCP